MFSNPYSNEATEEERQPTEARGVDNIRFLITHNRRVRRSIRNAARFVQLGRYREADAELYDLEPPEISFEMRSQVVRLQAVVGSRLGRLAQVDFRDVTYASPTDSLAACDFLELQRFGFLRPRTELMRRRLPLDPATPSEAIDGNGELLEHRAALAVAEGRCDDARDILSDVHIASPDNLDTPTWARALATLGEANRRLGRRVRARSLLLKANLIQGENELLGDRRHHDTAVSGKTGAR